MLEIHPVAKLWPVMSDADFTALMDDIRENGQQVPIQLYDGQIIDGAHRYKACVELGVEPDTQDWDGTEAQLIPHVVSLNDRRRHLTASQRAMIAEKIAVRGAGRRPDPIGSGEVSRKEAAKLMNVGKSSIIRARTVVDSGVPELAEAVEKGDVSLHRAGEIAKLPKTAQQEAIQRAPPERKKKKAQKKLERVDCAIDRIEGMAEFLSGLTISDDPRRTEWSSRLRASRTKISRFIMRCEKMEAAA